MKLFFVYKEKVLRFAFPKGKILLFCIENELVECVFCAKTNIEKIFKKFQKNY